MPSTVRPTRLRFMAIVAFSIAAAFPLAGRSLAPNSVVSGVVTDESGQPVVRASVVLRSAEARQRPEYGTLTDADGAFVLEDVVAGRYRLQARKEGLVDYEHGRRHPRGPGAIIVVSDPGVERHFALRMQLAASLAGRVSDEQGHPLAGAAIRVYRESYGNGERTFVGVSVDGESRTDDRGEYRVHGLAPDTYYVAASYSPEVVPPGKTLRVDQSDRTQAYLPTFFPGVPDPRAAAPLELTPGSEVRGIDVPLTPQPTSSIRGWLAGCRFESTQAVHISIGRRSFTESDAPVRYMGRLLDGDGRFEFRGVPSGDYAISVLVRDRSRQWGEVALSVGGDDTDDLIVPCEPSPIIEGRIRWQGNSDRSYPPEGSENPTISFRELQGSRGYGTSIDRNGTFGMGGIRPGRYRIAVDPLPDDAYVASIRVGSGDVLGEGLLGAAHIRGVEVVLDDGAAWVGGSAVDAEGQAMSNVRVVLVPEERLRHRSDLYSSAYTDEHGRFHLVGLTPGRYEAFAWDHVEGRRYEDPSFLERFRASALAIEVGPGDRLMDLQLTVQPAR